MSIELRALADMQVLRLDRKVPEHREASQLDVSLRWGYSTDLLDPTPFLEGRELILTTAQQLRSGPTTSVGNDAEAGVALEMRCREYVERLVSGGVAGIVYTLAEPDPDLARALYLACAAQSMPLFEAPYDVPFLRIAETIAEYNNATAQGKASHLGHAQHALTLAGLSPEPVTAIVRELAVLTGTRVVVENAAGVAIVQSSRRIAARGMDVKHTDAMSERSRARSRRIPLGLGGRTNGTLVVSMPRLSVAGASAGSRGEGSANIAMMNLAAVMIHLAIGARDRRAEEELERRAVTAILQGDSAELLDMLRELTGHAVRFPAMVNTFRNVEPGNRRSVSDREKTSRVRCQLRMGKQRVGIEWGRGDQQRENQQGDHPSGNNRWLARTRAELVIACQTAFDERNSAMYTAVAQAITADPLLAEFARDERVFIEERFREQTSIIMRTFVIWVDARCSWNAAARTAHMHRTTVERHVRGLAEVTYLDLVGDPAARHWLYLVCKMFGI